MKVRVVTLMWGTAWERYGKDFVRTLDQHWPRSVDRLVFVDHPIPYMRADKQVLFEEMPEIAEFKTRYGQHPGAAGIRPTPTAKVDDNGYSWRHDALKWAPQGIVPAFGLVGLEDGDIFVWLDADVETTSDVPDNWIPRILGDADVAMLQRAGQHSEIGFYALRVSHETTKLLQTFAALYLTGQVFDLKEWHSAYVFDRALERQPGLKIKNLSPGIRGHVWPKTVLAEHTIHKKGKRKDK